MGRGVLPTPTADASRLADRCRVLGAWTRGGRDRKGRAARGRARWCGGARGGSGTRRAGRIPSRHTELNSGRSCVGSVFRGTWSGARGRGEWPEAPCAAGLPPARAGWWRAAQTWRRNVASMGRSAGKRLLGTGVRIGTAVRADRTSQPLRHLRLTTRATSRRTSPRRRDFPRAGLRRLSPQASEPGFFCVEDGAPGRVSPPRAGAWPLPFPRGGRTSGGAAWRNCGRTRPVGI